MTRLLLDSHVLLWYTEGDFRLPASTANRIRQSDELVVSTATVWELTIKMTLGKLASRPIRQLVADAGCTMLAITIDHAEAVATLPQLHKDPFDHMLLAQAMVEGLTLITHDEVLSRYGVPVLLV